MFDQLKGEMEWTEGKDPSEVEKSVQNVEEGLRYEGWPERTLLCLPESSSGLLL